MRQWSACIEMLFAKEHPNFADRIHAAKAAGFDAIEFWTTSNKDLDAVERALKETGVHSGRHPLRSLGRTSPIRRRIARFSTASTRRSQPLSGLARR